MKYVRDGKADYAVLPFENSSAGIVTDVYDLLVEFQNYIVDTFDVKIEHCLCGIPGATIDDIKDVYSHPQAIIQVNIYQVMFLLKKAKMFMLLKMLLWQDIFQNNQISPEVVLPVRMQQIFTDLIFYTKVLILMILIQHSLLLSAVRRLREEMQV